MPQVCNPSVLFILEKSIRPWQTMNWVGCQRASKSQNQMYLPCHNLVRRNPIMFSTTNMASVEISKLGSFLCWMGHLHSPLQLILMNKIQTKRGTCKIQFGHSMQNLDRKRNTKRPACLKMIQTYWMFLPARENRGKKKQSRSRNCTPWKFLVPDVQVGILLPHQRKSHFSVHCWIWWLALQLDGWISKLFRGLLWKFPEIQIVGVLE